MDLPEVIDVKILPNCVQLELDMNSELEAFKGHFDAIPIIPGVVQIQWALAFGKLHIEEITDQEIACLEKLKFQYVIQPGMKIILQLELIDNKLIFSFISSERKHSYGKIVIA